MRAIWTGIAASFFFAFTFVLNRLMSTTGGSWVWSASLRYLFMIPLLVVLVLFRRNMAGLLVELRAHPWQWLWWSVVGFGFFYAPLCFSAAYSPAWLVAGTWQFTIIAGTLLVPFFYDKTDTSDGAPRRRKRIPFQELGMSSVVLCGIGVMECAHSTHVSLNALLLGMAPILIASFAYPLGNRKMMELCEGRLDSVQRTLGMTLASLPVWIGLAFYGFLTGGPPSLHQCLQTSMVALFSGVIATVLFFSATDMAKGDAQQLAKIEATQATEVVFTVMGELLVIQGTELSVTEIVGLCLVVVGMVAHSLRSGTHKPLSSRQSAS